MPSPPSLSARNNAVRPSPRTATQLSIASHYSRTGTARKEHKPCSRPVFVSPWRPGRSRRGCCHGQRRGRRGLPITCGKAPKLQHANANPRIGNNGKWCQLHSGAARAVTGILMKDDAGVSMEPGSCSGSESESDGSPCPLVDTPKQEAAPVCVRVRVDGSVFPAERPLLAGESEYFRALFQSGMRESQQEEIRLQGLSARGFLITLSVLQGERPLLSADEIVEVIECAAFLQVQTLSKHLANIIDSDNCLLMYHTSAVYGLLDLFKSAALFIRDIYADLKDDLRCLPQEMISYVESLIPNSYVMVGTHSPSTKLLRDSCRTVCYLDEEEDDWRVLTSLPLDASTTMASVAVLDNKLYIVGGVADVSKNVVDSGFCYDPEADSWSVFPSPAQLRYNASLLGHEGALYALGGEFQRKPMASVEAFRPAKHTWSPAASLPRTATNVPCTKAMNRMFICLWRPKDATEIYEYVVERDQWELVTTLVRPQSYGHYMVSHRDNLYVMRNGPDDDFLRCMMDCYNLTTGEWTAIPGQYEALFTAAVRGDSVFTLNRQVTEEYAIRDLRWKSRKTRKGFPRIGTMWTFLLRLPRRKREPLEKTVPTSRQELGRHAVWPPNAHSSCLD
ncbi:kelch repeat and BTB domain-containing protein 13 [Alosa sapidissima]|uniref:kelch repeat and BTB domain-containing protein 13 n=1 Tax=Alosa sapidissima TaxID=34773 RepID=UPI001C0845BD|nr:kelch repeat and BTB domain-containing protein 13 [Alosa sapidissima]